MSRLLPFGLALAAALLLTACGGSSTKLIPEDRAQELKDTVDLIAQRVEDEQCSEAESALRRGAQPGHASCRAPSTPASRTTSTSGCDQVASRIEDDCKPAETATPDAHRDARPRRRRRRRPDDRRRPPTPTETPTDTPTATPTPTVEVPTVEPPDSGGVDDRGMTHG